jgi:N-acetylmuramoyl-L-alanine amidase
MSQTHTVKQGESLLSIAYEYNFNDWKSIYNHPKNKELRIKRPEPQILAPGDKIFIPSKNSASSLSARAHKKQTFKKGELEAFIRINLKNIQNEPYKNLNYKLEVRGKKEEGKTDNNGQLQMRIHPKIQKGKLILWDDKNPDKKLVWILKIGHMDPDDRISGIQGRLNNLGFYTGPIDGRLNDKMIEELKTFQKKNNLQPSGELDEQTKNKIKSLYK